MTHASDADRTPLDEPFDEPLSEVQERLMSYLDREMTPAERSSFEQQLEADPDLRKELERFRALSDLTARVALPEPTDEEVRRFWTGFYNRREWQLGWLLVAVGAVLLASYGLWLLMTATWIPWPLRVASLSAVVGFALLIGNTARLQSRVARYDRYRGVLR